MEYASRATYYNVFHVKNVNQQITTPAFRYHWQVLGVLLWLPIILSIDSPKLAEYFAYNQWIANLLTLVYFAWLYHTGSARLKRLMLLGVMVGTAGEVFFALVVGMYEYRLENVPVYVPPGHSIVYAAVYHFTREPWVRKNATLVRNVFLAIATAFSVFWLWWANDVYGFICFAVFLLIVTINKDSRLFFPVMYVLVCYLELLGTSIGNWYWHPILLNKYEAIPSGNPPAGISVFYFGFDIACLGFYMLSNLKRRARYDRQKAYKKALLKADQRNKVASWHRLGETTS